MTGMARRRGGDEYQDPTLWRATRATRVDALTPVLNSLISESTQASAENRLELVWGAHGQAEVSVEALQDKRRTDLEITLLVHGLHVPLGRIADRMGVSPEWVRQRASIGLSRLRHPSRSVPLRGYDSEPLDVLPSPLIQSLADAWEADLPAKECLQCGDTLKASPGEGRRRQYCSSRCRQAAYRARKGIRTHGG